MRILLIAVTFVAGCASASQPQHMAKADPLVGSQAPRGSIEQTRTGQDVARTPNATPALVSPAPPLP
jgi:hypothetical protein